MHTEKETRKKLYENVHHSYLRMVEIIGHLKINFSVSSLYFKIAYSKHYFCNEFLKRKIIQGIRKI